MNISNIFSRIRPTASAIDAPDISAFVEYTETPPLGGKIVRIDKNLSGSWAVELSDGQYVMLSRLAACWLHNNPARGRKQTDIIKVY